MKYALVSIFSILLSFNALAGETYSLLSKMTNPGLEALVPGLEAVLAAKTPSNCVTILNRVKINNRSEATRQETLSKVMGALEPFESSVYGWGLISQLNNVTPEVIARSLESLTESPANAKIKASADKVSEFLVLEDVALMSGVAMYYRVKEGINPENNQPIDEVTAMLPMNMRLFVDDANDEMLAVGSASSQFCQPTAN